MSLGLPKAFLLLGLFFLGAGVQAQKIYRCGSGYSQVPCDGAVEIDANDARSAEQKAASEKAIARDGHTANALEKARLQAEKQGASQNRQSLQPQVKTSKVTEKTSAKSAKTEKKDKAEPFVAKAGTPSSK